MLSTFRPVAVFHGARQELDRRPVDADLKILSRQANPTLRRQGRLVECPVADLGIIPVSAIGMNDDGLMNPYSGCFQRNKASAFAIRSVARSAIGW